MKKAGNILIVSDMEVEKQEIYLLYKKREVVEKMFDVYKTVLNADKLYLQDDESVFGYVFTTFLSLYIHCKLEQLLKKAELNHKFTPIVLLFKYSKVYHFEMGGCGMITEVPKKVRNLDEALGFLFFIYVPRKYSELRFNDLTKTIFEQEKGIKQEKER